MCAFTHSLKDVRAYQVTGTGLADEDKTMSNSEAYNHFTVQWEGRAIKYLTMQSTIDVHRGVHLVQNEEIREYFLKGWLLSHVIKKILVSHGKGRSWMSISEEENPGHCCHCSSYSFLQPHAHICYATLVKHGACNKNYFIKSRVLNLLLDHSNGGF